MRVAAVSLSRRSFCVYCDPNGISLKIGDVCVVEDKRVTEAVGVVDSFESRCDCQLRTASLPRVLRLAEPREVEDWERLPERETEAIRLCKEQARALGLDMKIASVRFDDRQRRVLFEFTAEKRVDFRQLVKDLASVLRARIELWQIGVRDESRQLRGYGICGRDLCCGCWIKDFHPVSIRQAKDQDLLLSPAKLSGLCGRLRCCLAYEHAFYREAGREAPPIGSMCRTASQGMVAVLDRNLIRQSLMVRNEQGELLHIPFEEVLEIVGKASPSLLRQSATDRLSAALSEASGGEPPAAKRAEPRLGELEDSPRAAPAVPSRPAPRRPAVFEARRPQGPATPAAGESKSDSPPESAQGRARRPRRGRKPPGKESAAKAAPAAAEAKPAADAQEQKQGAQRGQPARRRPHGPRPGQPAAAQGTKGEPAAKPAPQPNREKPRSGAPAPQVGAAEPKGKPRHSRRGRSGRGGKPNAPESAS